MSNTHLKKKGQPDPTIYLHRTVLTRPPLYSLRLSFWDIEQHCFRTSKLFDLGTEPEEFLHYPNDTCFQLDTDLVYRIEKLCGRDMETELEHLLWPFVDPTVQRKMDHFFFRGAGQVRLQKGSKLLSFDGQAPHVFDKRRLHFLRFGSTNQGRIFQMPPRLEAKLLDRSRDELEQFFLKEEAELRETEFKTYLYTALNLQKHFTENFARRFPQALPAEKIDNTFVKELCLLNDDKNFWQERTDFSKLPDYLIRYLILFFDSIPRRNRGFEQAAEFQGQYRQFHRPERKYTVSKDEIATLFGESAETLRKADKKEIIRLYRQKAKSIHPDTGGDHEEFVKLTEAYEELLRSKQKM
ncbi:DnaJ domain-containing protein [Desulfocapsa sp. AH-315-G09]|uniref:DnaJ domain-containing protein n=1 Tax=Desulfotalea psychrophila TaxID=84980 RepID=A0ABS3ASC0_9BACT|nr:DnaJ domain-containing protein [Desulfocapsa sp.]MBN4065216.1 DnaJ domain-containing protein [Desulfocapsa sp. AH-315-G09]MBN4068030.1 DnaJ domain-containing protein [Desulfotalea psychrophila]